MRAAEFPFVDEAQQEHAHRPGGQQLSLAFGVAEARQVDGHKSRSLGETRPDRVPCEQALGPWVQEQDRLVSSFANLGVPDEKAVGRTLLWAHLGHQRTVSSADARATSSDRVICL